MWNLLVGSQNRQAPCDHGAGMVEKYGETDTWRHKVCHEKRNKNASCFNVKSEQNVETTFFLGGGGPETVCCCGTTLTFKFDTRSQKKKKNGQTRSAMLSVCLPAGSLVGGIRSCQKSSKCYNISSHQFSRTRPPTSSISASETTRSSVRYWLGVPQNRLVAFFFLLLF